MTLACLTKGEDLHPQSGEEGGFSKILGWIVPTQAQFDTQIGTYPRSCSRSSVLMGTGLEIFDDHN